MPTDPNAMQSVRVESAPSGMPQHPTPRGEVANIEVLPIPGTARTTDTFSSITPIPRVPADPLTEQRQKIERYKNEGQGATPQQLAEALKSPQQ